MEPRRIAFLYSVARSGSTYVEKSLGAYLAQHWGHAPLSELLNITLPVDFQENRIIPDVKNWRETQYLYTVDPIQAKQEILQRLDWLEQTDAPYFFKVLQAESRPEYLARLIPQSTLFFCRRENIWEHLLSYLISRITSQYYPEGGIKWEHGSIEVRLDHFIEFFFAVKSYNKQRAQNPQAIEFIFEHCLQDIRGHMKSRGLDKDFDWESAPFPPRENLQDKQLAFSNLDEIRSWYINSSLNIAYPIPATET